MLLTLGAGPPSAGGAFSPAQLANLTTSLGSVAESRAAGLLFQDPGKTTLAVADGDLVRVAVCPYTGVNQIAPSALARMRLTDYSNGKWALVGDGTQTYLGSASNFTLGGSGLAAAYTPALFTNFDGLLSGDGLDAGNDLLLTGTNGAAVWFQAPVSLYRLNGVAYTAGNELAPVNDVAGTITLNRTTTHNSAWRFGQDRANAGRNWEGPIFGIINVSAAMSAGDITLLETWLRGLIP